MPGESTPRTLSPSEGSGPRAPWAARMMDRGEDFVRKILAPLRPRVSLASGSVLVLLTLFLPIGYQSCGPETRGYELLQGKGDWPTFVGITLTDYFGPIFYGLVLALAASTLIFTVISIGNPGSLRNRVWNHRLMVVSGMLSLFLIADVLVLLPLAANDYGAVASVPIILSCLLPGKFWPKRIFWTWFGVLILVMLTFFGLTALKWIERDAPAWFLLGIWSIYALVPLALWWAGLSGRLEPNWNDVRRGLIAFYLPGVLGNICFSWVAWREGIWGFVPCMAGLHLMSLGYWRLARAPLEAANNDIVGFPPEISSDENQQPAQP